MTSKKFLEAQRRHQRGDLRGALRIYQTIVADDPDNGRARLYYALALQQVGNIDAASVEAAKAFARISSPNFADYSTLGLIQKGCGRLSEAISAFENGLRLQPGHPALQSNLATTFLASGQIARAEEVFRELVDKLPEDPAPALNLVRILMRTGRLDEAQNYLDIARRKDPSHPDYLALQANFYLNDANHSEAFKLLVQLLEKAPAHRDGWRLLRLVDAADLNIKILTDLLGRVCSLRVDSARVLSSAVALARHNIIWEHLSGLEAQLESALLSRSDIIFDPTSVFDLLATNVSQSAHKVAASQAWTGLTAHQGPSGPKTECNDNLKLKVGLISSDFREHAIGHLIVGLIEKLDHSEIEWVAYTNSGDDGGGNRIRFRESFDEFTSVYGLSDAQLSEVIQQDSIDIIIDLNGMTADSRSPVLAKRVAPIQIQWLGMPGTLGAGEHVDYVIVDPWVVDQHNADGFSEALLMLPRSYQPNDHRMPDFQLCASRAEAGLPEEGVIFGCFNQHYKISPDTFELWMGILDRVPGSYLWLLEPKSDTIKERLVRAAERQGVDVARLIFAGQRPQQEHIARLRWMDLVLDTWPYNAHTTCSDALRAGVPVITFPQATFASRVAAGILGTAGLDDWIVHSPEAYVEKAVAFGLQGREAIDGAKAKVKETYWSSPMVDNAAFARQFEALLLQLQSPAFHWQHP